MPEEFWPGDTNSGTQTPGILFSVERTPSEGTRVGEWKKGVVQCNSTHCRHRSTRGGEKGWTVHTPALLRQKSPDTVLETGIL